MAFASAMSSTAGYGLAFWVPSILIQAFGFDLTVTSYFYGSLLLVGGVTGVFLGGVLADKLGKADRGAYAKVSALAWLLTAPLFIAGLLSPSPVVAWLFLLIPNALNILFVGPLTTATQHLVPAHMRATAAACFLFINNLIGIGAGSWLLGGISDVMKPQFGDDGVALFGGRFGLPLLRGVRPGPAGGQTAAQGLGGGAGGLGDRHRVGSRAARREGCRGGYEPEARGGRGRGHGLRRQRSRACRRCATPC
jgi:MFS family permease